MSNKTEGREDLEYWDIYCELPRFSFIRGGEDEKGSVRRVSNKSGNWLEENDVSNLIDEIQTKINLLQLENRRLSRG